MKAPVAIAPARSVCVDALHVQVYDSAAELAIAAAAAVRTHLRLTLEAQGEARVILACATSQIQFLAALTRLEGIDWSRITVFHMDEYLGIAEDHPASFRGFLRRHLLDRVHPRATHLLAGDALLPEDECVRYSRLLREEPVDLCCLGIGENGHLAFNDPPVADFADARWVKIVKLDEACRQQQVGEGCFPTLASVPQYALTLTVPALCESRRLVCVVPDRRKAEAVRTALHGPIASKCPASALRLHPNAFLYLDPESASLL
jgi:glucosamine-6-phosphate deaminase